MTFVLTYEVNIGGTFDRMKPTNSTPYAENNSFMRNISSIDSTVVKLTRQRTEASRCLAICGDDRSIWSKFHGYIVPSIINTSADSDNS